MEKKFVIFLLFAGIVGGGYSFNQHRKAHDDQGFLTLYGNVDIRDVLLGFRVAGLVKTLHFEEGDQVEKGVVLATLDKEPYEKALAARQAELAEAQALHENAVKIYERTKTLVKKVTASESDFDTAIANRDATKAKLETAKAQLEQAQISLNDTEMHSPDKGTILTRVREPGSVVSEGTTVYTLALDNPVWVRIYIDEPNLGTIHPGQKAVVLTDSGQEYQAKIGFISPQAEFTPKNVETTQLRTSLVYRLRVVVDNPNNGLRQGMPVTVKIKK
ncbi:efflux RND transporter periplasmic adaptor subunit [Candidatus Finniella inopinata]|uniref:Efflux RND transporter periplasmic adaptor subunit n=1 Tax=Candidatus Finniella inopinata TaxID=1696036 RepID=A0A4Q7DLS4_9PROT|nr:efflux RND transporter periplasmic adaptor subunit [Candidatus Finniella inopinata]RZI47144.1 efflux RND transporter periplasmic adaptor subunit [Candidatus Finniella inopinata]